MQRAASSERAGAAANVGCPRRTALLLAGLLTLMLALALVPRAEAYVYWANNGGSTIGRADLDGTLGSVNQSFLDAGTFPRWVTVDGAHIYWVADDGTSVGRADLDGNSASVDEDFIPTGNICGVAVDVGHVYWSKADGMIGRANLDGTGVDEAFIATGISPCALAVAGGFIYWDDSLLDQIGRAALSSPEAPDNAFIPDATDPNGIAVTGTHVYWANTGDNAIGRAALGAPGSPDNSFISGANIPCGVAVHEAHVYWANAAQTGSPSNSIGRAAIDAPGSPDQNFITGADEPCGVAVDALPLPPPSPSNDFDFGKVKKNKKKGTAKLTVELPGAGDVELAQTKKVKGAQARAEGAGEVVLPVKPRGKTKKKLRRSGEAKVQAPITFTPEGGEPNTETKTLKLKQR